MDYTTLKHLKERSDIAELYNTASDMIKNIRSQLNQYEEHINNSLEEAEDLYVVSEANINAALDGLRTANNTFEIYRHKG